MMRRCNGVERVTDQQPHLVRAIGRWTLTALMVNTIVGAGIAGLPSLLAAHLGRLSPAGYVLAIPGVALIAACFAEVASQFQQAGGPYLYTEASQSDLTAQEDHVKSIAIHQNGGRIRTNLRTHRPSMEPCMVQRQSSRMP